MIISTLIALLSASLFVCFSVAVQSYISMATPIGPWIEPIVALAMLLLSRIILFFWRGEENSTTRVIGLTTAAAGVGGAVAIAFGFAFPTLYFWDKALFDSWMANPGYLVLVTGGITLAGGCFAFMLASYFEKTMLDDPKMPFPIGEMVGKMLSITDHIWRSITLAIGFVATLFVSAVQWTWQLVPDTFTLLSGGEWGLLRIPRIILQMDLVFVYLAIGFIAGSILVVPLLVGVISKTFLLVPLHRLFFTHLSFNDTFIFAFAGGIILQEALWSVAKIPPLLLNAFKKLQCWMRSCTSEKTTFTRTDVMQIAQTVLALAVCIAYFSWMSFSMPAQLYLYLFTIVCVAQVVVIGGKAGMVPMGRYATFILLPGVFLFSYSYTQSMLVSLFAWLVGMITVDLLFGRVTARMINIKRSSVIWFQFFGLVLSAALVGIIFWLLITYLGLGSAALSVVRAQNRALLLTAWRLDIIVLVLGGLFGMLLNVLKINPVLVFTGLFIQEQYSLLLIMGGLFALLVKNREKWEPFWSGVFAGGSLWMLFKALTICAQTCLL